MKTLATVLAQIEKKKAEIDALNREADDCRKRERTGVIARIQEAIAAYGLTSDELNKPVKLPTGAVKQTKKRPPAYKHGAYYSNGSRVWRGHAMMPSWLIDHMAQTGKGINELEVSAPVPDKKSAKA